MLNLDTFVSVYDWFKAPFAMAALSLAIMVLVYLRTRSGHILWFRLWTLFVARRGPVESPVERFHDEQMAMLKFRWLTNIPVRTPAQVVPMIKWLKVHDQAPSAVAACGEYFDVAKPGLTQAAQNLKAWWILLPLLIGSMLFLIALAFGYGVVQDRALLQFKATKHWFTMDATRAKPFDSNAGFELSRCGKDAAQLALISGFEVSEVQMLCEAKNKHEVDSFVQSTLAQQRIVFGAWTIACLVMLLFFTRVFQRMNAVLELKRVLREREAMTPC